MSNTSRHETLQSVSKCVTALLRQLTPDPEIVCKRALRDLGTLTGIAKTLTADDVPSHFRVGIQDVINQLDAFRTGFARTAEQEGGDPLMKAASCFKPRTADLTVEDFVKHVDGIVRKAIKCAESGVLGPAVGALQTLLADISKAESFEDAKSETISVTVDNDPMRIVETEASGTTAPAGTSASSSAASNYVTNPGDVSTAPPSTAPNPSTTSAEGVRSAAPAGDSNFIAKGADPDAISKGIKSIQKAVAECEPVEKAQSIGWPQDLNTPGFMQGVGPKVRF